MPNSVTRFVVWICKKFTRTQVENIIFELSEAIKDPNAEIQPKDTFKENHPNYRNFKVDPKSPLKKKSVKKKRKKSGKRS